MIDIITRIKENEQDFSKSQKKIAEYVEKNLEKAAYLTAFKLSEKTGVSEATVVRFAEKIGFDGYPEFQKNLLSYAKGKLTSLQRIELAYEKIGEGNVLNSVLKSDIAHIEKTLENIDKDQFEKAANSISSANRIYITGVRSAAALAEFAGFYLHLIFDNVRLIKSTGGDDIFEQIMNIEKGDVFIGISFPRYSKNTIKALEYAKRSNATVIGITDSKNSPVASVCDYCLIAECDTTSFVDSLTAPISLINALIAQVGLKNRERVHKNFERLEKIWDEYEVYDKK
jgi:DNA-binding MurR/RpiR family transcriptional regulator